jgi:hypothetical protein
MHIARISHVHPMPSRSAISHARLHHIKSLSHKS